MSTSSQHLKKRLIDAGLVLPGSFLDGAVRRGPPCENRRSDEVYDRASGEQREHAMLPLSAAIVAHRAKLPQWVVTDLTVKRQEQHCEPGQQIS
ncbi:hypothetical protein OEZ60_18405 [Defluviimonas sp. WL0024]|uniref:Uncharacterized protein n=1 Tax=Albidovulum salinarum TaxID=2984153 RepID=A0ABT2X7Q2_9RHOB|nr:MULTISPECIES: hypothetical protein [Defluviimonas]MCU9849976.1 hypothetical protein [Defluviimonas sp. WL0024]